MDTGQYRDIAYWWDENDNQYTLECIWYYENGWNEIPDSWILESIAVDEQETNTPDITAMLSKDGDIWRMIESEKTNNPEYIDERDYSDYDEYREEIF